MLGERHLSVLCPAHPVLQLADELAAHMPLYRHRCLIRLVLILLVESQLRLDGLRGHL